MIMAVRTHPFHCQRMAVGMIEAHLIVLYCPCLS